VALVAVVLFAAVPSLRRRVTNEATTIRRNIRPHYPKIALQSATATGGSGCPAPRVVDNSVVYWYTRPVGGPSQALTVTVASTFKGNLYNLGVTPLPPAQGSAPAGGVLPYPLQLVVSAGSGQPPKTLVMANPPKFHTFGVRVTHPHQLQISATSTDPGAAPNSCAETAYIFYDRT
jgi:hypothetical protein